MLQRTCTITVCPVSHHFLVTDSSTGLDLARLADLPDDVLAEARRVSEKLTELEERKKEESKTNKVAIRRKALLRVMFCSVPVSCFALCSLGFLVFLASVLGCSHLPDLAHWLDVLRPPWQLRTQLTQAFEHSNLPDDDFLTYIGRFQKDIAEVLQDTL